jgi:hypothetical protein
MIPAGIVVAAIAYAAPTLAPEARDRYAGDIAAVVEDTDTAMALVATAAIESRFRAKIERCHCERWECDGGKAFGLFQLHSHWLDGHSRFEVCADNRLSTELAAKAIVTLRRRTGAIRMDKVFARYVGARLDDDRVIARWALYESLLAIDPPSS